LQPKKIEKRIESMSEKLFAIGDIHGRLDKLVLLMDRIVFEPKRDRIVFLGDYIDRGPSSRQTIDFLIRLKNTCPKAVFLKGNHEQMLQDYLSGKDRAVFLANGGRQTIRSYREKSSGDLEAILPDEHLRFFRNLLLYWETENFIFVHAGLREGVELEKQSPRDLLWSRGRFIDSRHDFGKIVVFGHTPFAAPYVSRNKIGVDTGAVYGNKLTAVELTRMEFFSV
jgi:serine/threonine protein phosphatase 1